jgi:hypothetical protein
MERRLLRLTDDGFTYHAINREVVLEDDTDLDARLVTSTRTQVSSEWAHRQCAPGSLWALLPDWSDRGRNEASRQAAWRAPMDAPPQSIRATLRSGQPYGDPAWAEAVSSSLGRTPPSRPRGRPRKEVRA